MHEPEPADRESIRQNLSAALLDELMPPAQFLAPRFDIAHLVVERGGESGQRKFRARNAGRFENALVERVETIELRFNQLPDRVRHSELDRVNRRRESPAAIT